ncbi:cyclin-T1-like isoform X2 [Nilaparvata lugens]|uniref:cyclin-T1-like isoform X2 n=1 Tax=Nilaparvata lugens TaxID=108931 RepID=UPI00193D6782|nr:cyclin-T1-like isoform X2 [Nilaparvata lugens]
MIEAVSLYRPAANALPQSRSSRRSAEQSPAAVQMSRPSPEDRWYFTKEQLNNTPSIRLGYTPDNELSCRQQAANFIQDMGHRLQVTQQCTNTAIVYMHRFYMFHSFTHFHHSSVSAAAILLAAKVEEQPRKLGDVIKVAHMCLHRDQHQHLDTKSEQYQELAQDLVVNEDLLLQTLGFDVAIDHPRTHVVRCCELVNAREDLAQTSYFMASNILHLTTMCLQYKPTLVACFCIHLASRWSNCEIPESNEGRPWFYYVDSSVTQEALERLTSEFLIIFDKCHSRLKDKVRAMCNQNHNPIPQHSYDYPAATTSATTTSSSRPGMPESATHYKQPGSHPHSSSSNHHHGHHNPTSSSSSSSSHHHHHSSSYSSHHSQSQVVSNSGKLKRKRTDSSNNDLDDSVVQAPKRQQQSVAEPIVRIEDIFRLDSGHVKDENNNIYSNSAQVLNVSHDKAVVTTAPVTVIPSTTVTTASSLDAVDVGATIEITQVLHKKHKEGREHKKKKKHKEHKNRDKSHNHKKKHKSKDKNRDREAASSSNAIAPVAATPVDAGGGGDLGLKIKIPKEKVKHKSKDKNSDREAASSSNAIAPVAATPVDAGGGGDSGLKIPKEKVKLVQALPGFKFRISKEVLQGAHILPATTAVLASAIQPTD